MTDVFKTRKLPCITAFDALQMAMKARPTVLQGVLAAIGAAAARSNLPEGIAPRSYAPPPRRNPASQLVAASLAGGMIGAGGKAISAEEAVGVWREVREAQSR